MKYLVVATHGPIANTPKEIIEILKTCILPTFDVLLKLEKKRIVTGGLPVGERSISFILEAHSNDEADRILRELPAWGALEWKVTPLQSLRARAQEDRQIVAKLKKTLK